MPNLDLVFCKWLYLIGCAVKKYIVLLNLRENVLTVLMRNVYSVVHF